MRQKFTLITLGVRDFKKALAFYENLGWQKSDKSKGIIQLFIVSLPKVPEFWCSFFSNTKLLIFGNFYFIIGKSLNSFLYIKFMLKRNTQNKNDHKKID